MTMPPDNNMRMMDMVMYAFLPIHLDAEEGVKVTPVRRWVTLGTRIKKGVVELERNLVLTALEHAIVNQTIDVTTAYKHQREADDEMWYVRVLECTPPTSVEPQSVNYQVCLCLSEHEPRRRGAEGRTKGLQLLVIQPVVA